VPIAVDRPAALTAAITASESPAPAATVAMRHAVAAAEEGFRLLRILLHGGRTSEADGLSSVELTPAAWLR
jgi:hypothetical protein